MTHVTCRLTAKNRDQLRNPTLGNRVWALSFLLYSLIKFVEYMQVLYTMLISVSRTRRRFAWCASWNYRKVCTWSACIATAIPNHSAVEYSASRQSMFADSEFHHGRISCRKTNRERKRAEKVSESCLIKLLLYILAENSFLFFLFIFWFRAIITLLFASFRAHAKVCSQHMN